MVEGTEIPLWGMEVDPEKAQQDFRASSAKDGGKVGVCSKKVIFLVDNSNCQDRQAF